MEVKYRARNLDTDEYVNPGDTVFDFRGEAFVFKAATSSNKVMVEDRPNEFYAKVFNLRVVKTKGK